MAEWWDAFWNFIKRYNIQIGFLLAAIPILWGIVKGAVWLFRRLFQKPDPGKRFPFEVMTIDRLAPYLLDNGNLTATDNPYVVRVPEIREATTQSSLRKILIIGRAGIGKTRYALEYIKQEAANLRARVLMFTGSRLTDQFDDTQLEQCLPQANLFDHVFILLDDYFWLLYHREKETGDAKMVNPKEQFDTALQRIERLCGKITVIATSRWMDRPKIKDTFHDPEPPEDFCVHRLEELAADDEQQLIKGLTQFYQKEITRKTIDKLMQMNQGFSSESLVVFFQKYEQRKITAKDCEQEFKRHAGEYWKRRSFDQLPAAKKEAAEHLFKALRLLRLDLGLSLYASLAQILTAAQLPGRWWFFRWRRAGRTIQQLTQAQILSLPEKTGIFKIPDYILEIFPAPRMADATALLFERRRQLAPSARGELADYFDDRAYDYLVRQQDPKQALALWTKSLQLKKDNARAWYNRGVALEYNQAGERYGKGTKLEDALASYEQALKFQPEDADAWYNRGVVLGNMGKNEEELASYEQALKFQPEYARAWSNRGNVLFNLGKNEDALASYEQALKFQPGYYQAWYNKAKLLYHLKRLTEAKTCYESFLRFAPPEVEPYIAEARSRIEEIKKLVRK